MANATLACLLASNLRPSGCLIDSLLFDSDTKVEAHRGEQDGPTSRETGSATGTQRQARPLGLSASSPSPRLSHPAATGPPADPFSSLASSSSWKIGAVRQLPSSPGLSRHIHTHAHDGSLEAAPAPPSRNEPALRFGQAELHADYFHLIESKRKGIKTYRRRSYTKELAAGPHQAGGPPLQ